MLELDSPRWTILTSSAGGDGRLAAQLIQQIRTGDDTAYDELTHQACHQFTAGEVGYAVVPWLVRIAESVPLERQLAPLTLIGSIVASRSLQRGSVIPVDLADAYDAAICKALPLVTAAIRDHRWETYDSYQLIATVASLRGLTDLAMLLFLSGPELSCPECGEYIRFGEAS